MFTNLEVYRNCANLLEDKGFSLSVEPVSPALRAEMAGIGKQPSRQTFGEDVCDSRRFWLVMRRSTGNHELVGTLAARLDVIERDPGAFLEAALERYWCDEGTVTLHLPERLQEQLTGPSVYLGDLYFKSEITGDRQKTFAFVHAAYALAFARWPEARSLYVYVRMADYLERNPIYGFTSAVALNAVEWSVPQAYRSAYECLVTLTQTDFRANMEALLRCPELFEELPSRRPRGVWSSVPSRQPVQLARQVGDSA